MHDISRRDLLKRAALAGTAVAAGGSFHPSIAADGTAGSPPDVAPPAALARVSMKGVPYAATWSAPFPLSGMSVAKGSAPIAFPDFTRGAFTSARATG